MSNSLHCGDNVHASVLTRDVYLIGQPETPRVWVKLGVNGKTVCGLIDTGAENSMIH